MIEEAVDKNMRMPMRAGKNGPIMSHLLFGDDLLIFVEATPLQIDGIIRVLDDFCGILGHKINRENPIFFSKNVPPQKVDDIISRSGFTMADGIGRYLGALCRNGKGKKKNFKGIMDRMGNKLYG